MNKKNQRMMNICIDIDGTVTDATYWLKHANAHFNRALTPADVTEYNIDKVLGIDQAAYDAFYAQYGEAMHRESDIRPEASAVINRLYENHRIHFVTARSESMRPVSLEWLKRHRIPLDTISLLGSHDKVRQARELNCDLFIEDRYENAIQLSLAGFKVLLVDCPYNRGALPRSVQRISSWSEVEPMIAATEETTQTAPALTHALPGYPFGLLQLMPA
jgi:hypothetical protein